MVKFINKTFGNIMYVAESRVEEYKEAGHRLASEDTPKTVEHTEEKPKRTAIKKTVRK